MAQLTGQLSTPGTVTGSSAPGLQLGQAIGGGLSGLADILDVGLKASAQARQDKLTGGLETQLVGDVNLPQYNAAQQKLVGETDDNAAANANPGVQHFNSTADKVRAALNQNPERRNDYVAKLSSDLQAAIAANPRFADALRQRASQVLGFNPTAELASLQIKDMSDAAVEKKAFENAVVSRGVQLGVTQIDPKTGMPDFAATSAAVEAEEKRVRDRTDASDALTMRMKNLDITKTQLEIGNLRNGPKMTAEQQVSAQADAIARGVDKAGKITGNGADTLWQNMIGSGSQQLLAYMRNITDPQDAKAFATVSNAYNQMKARFYDNLNAQERANGTDTRVMEELKKRYDLMFEPFDNALGGKDLSPFKNVANLFETTRNIGGQKALEAFPGLTALEKAIPGAGAEGLSILLSDQNAPSAVGMAREVQTGANSLFGATTARAVPPPSATEQINNAHGLATGQIKLDNLPTVQEQTMALNSGRRLQMMTTQNGGKELTPPALTAFGHLTTTIAETGIKAQDPNAVMEAARHVITPQALATFDRYAKENKESAQPLGDNMFQLAIHAIQTNARGGADKTLNTPRTVTGPTGQLQASSQPIGYSMVYNASAGKFEVSLQNTDMGKIPLTPPAITNQIRDLNYALDAATHLKQYGGDHFANMSDNDLKFELTKGAGIPVKGAPLSAQKKDDNVELKMEE